MASLRAGHRPARRRSAIAVLISGFVVIGLFPLATLTPAFATATATKLVFTSEPGTGAPGLALASQPSVTIEDSSGNAVTGDTSVVAITLTPVSLSGSGALGVLSCSHTSSTASSGVAGFANCAVSRGGLYTLTARDTTDNNLTATSTQFFISGPAQLVITGQPNGGTAGAVWSAQPQVTVEDANGVALSADSTKVGVAIKGGTGTAAAALSCTTNPITATNGVATFAGCSIDKSGTGYELYAVDPTDELLSAPSSSFAISVGSAAKIAFTTQPTGAAGGKLLATQPVVTVKDSAGNPVTGNSDQITLSITANTGASGAKIACTASSVQATNGVATFAGCAIDKAGAGYTLTATDSVGSKSTTSAPFTVSAGGAVHIGFTTEPSGGAGGAAFSAQPVVTLTDSGGNPVAGAVTLAIKPNSGTSGAVLTCATNPLASSGVTSFAGCAINATGNDYVLSATSGSLTVDSSLFAVTGGVAGKIQYSTEPTGGSGGSALSTQPVVAVTDSGGNPAAGAVTLSITPGTGTPGATLTCDSTTVTADNGAATFTGCDVDKTGLGYSLTATLVGATGVIATSTSFSVSLGSPARLQFLTEPGPGTGGSVWSFQPQVAVEDAGGNLIAASTAAITLTVTSGTGSGALSCVDDPIAAVLGVASFAGCAIDKTASAYTLTAHDAADDLSAVSATFAVVAGSPSHLVFTTQPDGATSGSVFTGQPEVTIEDAGGNAVASDPSAIALSSTSGTGTAGATLSCGTNSMQAGSGVAQFSGCAIDRAGSGYTLTATDATDALSAESLPFAALLSPHQPLGLAPTAVPFAQTVGARLYAANPTTVTDDVNSATGALQFSTTDLKVAGIGEALVLARSYNSLATAGGSFGSGWSSIFDLGVKISSDHKTATVRGEDGQQVAFTSASATNSWIAPPGATSALKCTDKMCTVSRFDGVSFDAVPNGRVSDYLARDGQGLRFTYANNTVTVSIETSSTSPLLVHVMLNSAGQVASVTTPAGRKISYAYTSNLLTSFTDADHNVWTYGYDGSGRLTSESVAGSSRLSVSYASGRVASISAKGSSRHTDDTFSWDSSTQTSTRAALTNVGGSLVRENYTDRYLNNSLVAQTSRAGAVIRYSYDANENLTEIQDPMGWVEQLGYDANNNLISQSTPISSSSAAVITMTYDDHHRMLTQRDADGNTTQFIYNGPYLGFIRPPGGPDASTRYKFNKLGELESMQTPIGVQQYTYDAAGNRTGVVLQDLDGHSLNGAGTKSTYNEAGAVTRSLDPRGNLGGTPDLAYQTTWTFDALGNLLSTTTPGGNTTTNTYDAAGHPLTTTDPAGNKTTYAWDETTLTRTVTVTPAGASTSSRPTVQTYDPSGNELSETNPAKQVTSYVYDADGRQISSTDASNVTVQTTYDIESNVVKVSDSTGNTVTRQYDSLNRPIRTVNNGAVTTTGYDPAGNVIASTNTSGARTNATYTADNKVASVTNPAGTTSYTYDQAGDLISTRDPDGRITTSTFDGAGRRISNTIAGATTTYTYDSAGNIISTTDPDGRNTTFVLDALDRPTKATFSQPGHSTIVVTQAYDSLGNRISITDPTGSHTYTYDAVGDLTSATSPTGTFNYDYSQPGKILETYPDGTKITYSLDDAENLMSVQVGTDPSALGYVKASYIRNAERQTTAVAYSNGVLETQQFDTAGNVVNQSLQNAGTPLANNAFTYDASGNQLSQTDTVLGTTSTSAYGYDATGRLTGFATTSTPSTPAAVTPLSVNSSTTSAPATTASITSPTVPTPTSSTPTSSGPVQSNANLTPSINPSPAYTYDGAGNRRSAITPAGTTTSTYNAADEVVSQSGPSGTTSWTYDESGNVTSIVTGSNRENFTYDAADHLVGVTTARPNGNSTVSYTYDGDGNRVTKTVDTTLTHYVWDMVGRFPQLAIETNAAGGLIRRYIYGDGPVAMQTPTATYFYHVDPIGTVSELTNSSGAVVAAYHYDAFGNVTVSGANPPTNPLLFQGQYLDSDTGLYNMRARNYDPATGQFTQRDPVELPAGAPAVSTYAFVGDRPTVFTDPTGRTPTATTIFWGHSSDAANIGNDTRMATTGLLVGVKAVSKFGGYSAAVEESATSGIATDASAAGESLGVAGKALGVIGIGLQTFITVEDCLHGTVQQCVADSVATAVSVAFTVGCAVATAGAGAVACGIVGGLLSAGLSYVIADYGPQIVTGIESLTTADWVGIGVAIGCSAATAGIGVLACAAAGAAIAKYAPQIVAGLKDAGSAIAGAATTAGDAITTGFNDTASTVSSGFQTALSTLVAAGYTAAQIAGVLVKSFDEGVSATVATLVSFGYDVQNVTLALVATFGSTAAEAGQFLKDSYAYTVNQIAGAIDDVYHLGVQDAAALLKGLNYGVDEVAGALSSIYGQTAAQAAAALAAVGYTVNQIGAALLQAYQEAGKDAAVILAGLNYTVAQVAGALESVYEDTDAAAASALQFASFAADQVAGALDAVYNDGAQAVATIMNGLNYTATQIVGALDSAYQLGDQAAAQILETIGFAANAAAGALNIVYNDGAQAVTDVLGAVGYAVDDIAGALNTVFNKAAQDISGILQTAGYDVTVVAGVLDSVFNKSAAEVATILGNIGDSVNSIGTAVAGAFSYDASQVATALQGAGYTANQISGMLQSDYGESVQAIAQTLETLNYSATQIANTLKDEFNQTDVEVAAVLNNIGESAANIATAVEGAFSEAAGAVASVLSDIGLSSSTIDNIGGDFSSFGSDLSSGWSTISSWF